MKKVGKGNDETSYLDENDFKSIDFEQVNQMADLFMANGFNFFDIEYSYHGGLNEITI